jgi:hypothetical protein
MERRRREQVVADRCMILHEVEGSVQNELKEHAGAPATIACVGASARAEGVPARADGSTKETASEGRTESRKCSPQQKCWVGVGVG